MEQKLKLEIFLLLPDVTGERDQCVERLKNLLQAKAGMNDDHLAVSADHPLAAAVVRYGRLQLRLLAYRAFGVQRQIGRDRVACGNLD